MPTVSLVSISVTAMLGFILVFAWWQEATSTLAGWWGLAQLVMSVGITIVVAAPSIGNNDLHAFGQACMILSAAISARSRAAACVRCGSSRHLQSSCLPILATTSTPST